MYKMTGQDQLKLYKDILIKSKIYCKRFDPDFIEPEDIANEVYIQFMTENKAKKFDKDRGASFQTWACGVAHNLLRNYMERKAKYKDDTKRTIGDTINDKNIHYFQVLANDYTDDKDKT
jgi:DNA-directed RNA polymerase specialized sigma24 family protein